MNSRAGDQVFCVLKTVLPWMLLASDSQMEESFYIIYGNSMTLS